MCNNLANTIMAPRQKWWIALFGDVQFWVPLIVLIIGILLLGFVK